MKNFALLCLLLLAASACAGLNQSDTTTAPTAIPPTFTLLNGFTATALPYEFSRPTQFFVDGSDLWIAQLNGKEGEVLGQVLRIDLESGRREVVIDNLDKPTGIALLDDSLWIATRDQLLRLRLDEESELEVIVTEIPNNGRSNGTLTVTPTGRLLYESSGTRRDGESGRLWELDPATLESRVVATGLKNGYAHVYDEQGRLWSTEVADGTLNDVPFPGELNLIVEGGDYGWSRCSGMELASAECASTIAPVTLFPVNSTPTGLALSPFESATFLVPLWLTGEVVAVTVDDDGTLLRQRSFIEGMANPQHVVDRPDGSVWVSEYGTGIIWRIAIE